MEFQTSQECWMDSRIISTYKTITIKNVLLISFFPNHEIARLLIHFQMHKHILTFSSSTFFVVRIRGMREPE